VLLGATYFCYAVYAAVILKATVPGWTSLVFLQVFFSGATLLAIGLMGEYLSRVYDESKRRPLYVLKELVNLPVEDRDVQRALLLEPRDTRPGSPVA
jgi:dolichol-phosphate mannosyltransferase